MKHFLIVLILFWIAISCSVKDKYAPSTYHDKSRGDSLLTSIITYIFIAPPYTIMQDRFKSEHRKFYADPNLLSKFSISKYYISDDGTNYFLVLRPAAKIGEKRAVGGYFKIGKNYQLTEFHEVFVTPTLSENEAKTKGAFLFDKMAKGEVQQYLKMRSYVQWPNDASYYDSVKYEWVLDQKKINN